MRSVTKTPFEISLNINDPESRYAAVVFDAEGNPLSPGSFVGTEGEYAIGERDISTVYVYVCDAVEYIIRRCNSINKIHIAVIRTAENAFPMRFLPFQSADNRT